MSVDKEWQKLCDDFRNAQDALWSAMAPVIKAQADVARGGSENASQTAYDALDAARKRYEDVDRRMDEFIDRHSRPTA